jgi:hypothetical protein
MNDSIDEIDPIVAEVRRIREEQAAALGFDIRRIIADSRSRERLYPNKTVSFDMRDPNRSNQSP